MGRRKIEIEPLTDERNRTVTFVKRKAGLFKKAHELAVLCQVDLAVIIVGNNNKIFEFSTVDTADLIKNYQKIIKSNKRPHESKSHENYSSYKKKKFLREPLTKKSGAVVGLPMSNIEEEDEEDEDESDYEGPELKRQKVVPQVRLRNPRSLSQDHLSITNMPTFNNPHNFLMDDKNKKKNSVSIKRDEGSSQRPVLRVQIPSDSKGNTAKKQTNGNNTDDRSADDTGRTMTADDQTTSRDDQRTSKNGQSGNIPTDNEPTTRNGAPGAVTPKFAGYSSFRSPESKKPTLPLPIHTKSQTSSPASASGPGLPNVANASSYYASLHALSPTTSAYISNILPTPVFNPPQQQQSQQQGPQQPPPIQTNQPDSAAARFRAPPATGISVGQLNMGEQTPISGLPSRYVNDMFPFPSPSNFLAPQDWPSGTTPTTHMPQYFMMPLTTTSTSFPKLRNDGNVSPVTYNPHPPSSQGGSGSGRQHEDGGTNPTTADSAVESKANK